MLTAMYKWLTFDCYGTLVDWEGGMKAAFAPVFKARGLEPKPDLTARYIQHEMLVERREYRPYRQVLTTTSRELFKSDYNVDLNDEEAAALVLSLPSWKPFPETAEVLARLKHRFKLAVLSNTDDDLVVHTLKGLGVEFDSVITAEQVRSYKPVNLHWKAALERFNAEPEDLFHVGASSLHDVLPAKQLGIACAWINRKGERAFGSAAADVILPDLTGLPGFLGL